MNDRDKQSEPLILVDGSSYLYRAFHAMPNLSTSRGESTGAIYGMVNMLRKLLADYNPDYIAVVFDAPGKTFRDELYAEYKAHRAPMPDNLVSQIESIHTGVRALGLPLLMIDGVEADDVIGTLATQARAAGRKTLIVTGDKDFAQLVGPQINLVNTMSNAFYDAQAVKEKFGVPPERIIDYLALVGDSVDNIPGVPNVGPKTAAKWLQTYGSLDAIVEHCQEIGGKAGENLCASLDKLPLSRELATIKCNVKLDYAPEDLKRVPPDEVALRDLYARFEFKTWLAELGGINRMDQAAVKQAVTNRYETIFDEDKLGVWIRRLEAASLFAFDTETSDLNVMRAELVGVSFTDKAGEGAYVPLAHTYPGAPKQLDRARVLERLKPLLENPQRSKVGQNLKYDMSVLARYGISLRGIRFDTMLESYVLDSTASRHDMDSLALKYLGYKTIKFEDVAGKGRNQICFDQVSIDIATTYAAEDADITLRLHEVLWPRLQQTPTLENLFNTIELPLVTVLSHIERNGVKIDADMLHRQSAEFGKRILELEREAHALAGQPFNMGSPLQIQQILYEKLKLPVLKKTPKGQPSTGEEVLQELALDYPLPGVILEHRGICKLQSTYTDTLPQMIDPDTRRVHTCYHQAVAATGRLSSSDPNLQNIPIRTAEGRRIRQAFIPEPGYKMMSADYSQIELRIMAHLSNDAGLLKAFAEDIDIHRATAAEVLGIPLDQVTPDQRRAAKAINFGLIYGMSAFGLARQLKIDRNAAQEYVDLYFARYPGVKQFMDRTRAQAHEQGYVETVFGRRLYLPEINTSNHTRRQYAERTAINAPMQGTAADIIKLAMLAVDKWIEESGAEVKMIMQVHDELVFEVAEQEIAAAQENIRRCMAGVARLSVPLVVEIGVGDNWDEAH
ncbi:MAG TPA: DNA polymerase I [Acidiferrobacterales bacterium]|nr:DNA polymerase I [Acidiferrobacterales bacterium]